MTPSAPQLALEIVDPLVGAQTVGEIGREQQLLVFAPPTNRNHDRPGCDHVCERPACCLPTVAVPRAHLIGSSHPPYRRLEIAVDPGREAKGRVTRTSAW